MAFSTGCRAEPRDWWSLRGWKRLHGEHLSPAQSLYLSEVGDDHEIWILCCPAQWGRHTCCPARPYTGTNPKEETGEGSSMLLNVKSVEDVILCWFVLSIMEDKCQSLDLKY